MSEWHKSVIIGLQRQINGSVLIWHVDERWFCTHCTSYLCILASNYIITGNWIYSSGFMRILVWVGSVTSVIYLFEFVMW